MQRTAAEGSKRQQQLATCHAIEATTKQDGPGYEQFAEIMVPA
jgi:hypothetical protein